VGLTSNNKWNIDQILNDSPQPQVFLAFGLLNIKPVD
jgi:hypothetical protein